MSDPQPRPSHPAVRQGRLESPSGLLSYGAYDEVRSCSLIICARRACLVSLVAALFSFSNAQSQYQEHLRPGDDDALRSHVGSLERGLQSGRNSNRERVYRDAEGLGHFASAPLNRHTVDGSGYPWLGCGLDVWYT